MSSLSTRQPEPLVEGGGGEREKVKYAKRTSPSGGQCSLTSLSTRQEEPLVEGGGGEMEKVKYAKRTSL